jgi:hypothetical protein
MKNATRASIEMIVMRVVTRFTTTEQFVAGFHRLCTETTIFIPTTDGKQIGIETGFSIRLADETPMLRGLCVVDELWTSRDNPYNRAGVLLSIRSITVDSRDVFEQIQRARLASASPSGTSSTEAAPVMDVTPTIEMAPLFASDNAGELGAHTDTAGLPMLVHDEVTTRMIGGTTIPIGRPPLSTILGVAPLFRPRLLGPGPLPVVVVAIVDGPVVTVLARTQPQSPTPHAWWSGIVNAARAATAFIARVGLRLIAPLRRRRRELVVARRPNLRPRVALPVLTRVRATHVVDAPVAEALLVLPVVAQDSPAAPTGTR